MTQKLHIAVLTHAIDEFDRGGYLLNTLIDQWQSRGMTFEVFRGTEDAPPDADLAIRHIDMTIFDDDYAALFEHYPLVINGKARDTSRTAVSDQIITQDDPWQGQVIVKTEMNFGGMREMRARFLAGDPDATIEIQRPWRKVEFLPGYPVFTNAAAVPTGVWRNPNLVVEKFRPEAHDDGEYALRNWVFLGDRGLYYQNFASEPFVKGKNTVRRVVLDVADVPPELREKREHLGFDYGKFDFGIVDGETVLYDINRTPGRPRSDAESKKVARLYPNLAEGLDGFLSGLAR